MRTTSLMMTALLFAAVPRAANAAGQSISPNIAQQPTATSSSSTLGNTQGADIEALAFVVLMEASKSAQDDLNEIMAGVKAINQAKAQLRKGLAAVDELPPSPCAGAAALRDCVRATERKLFKVEIAALDLMRGSVLAAQGELTQLRNALQQAPQEAERLRKHLPPPARPLPPSPCRGWNVRFWKDCIVAVKIELSGNLPDRASQGDIDQQVDQLKQDLDSMSELGEMESLRLQMATDRLSKMMSTLSNILKKISDTQQSITQNMK